MTKNKVQKNIPDEWEVKKLENISLDMIQGVNTAIDIPEYVDKGIPMLKANDIIDGKIDLTKTKFISDKTYEGYSERFKIQKNDFLFSNIGARLGTGSLFESGMSASFAWNVMRIIPNKLINPKFLYFRINSESFLRLILKNQSGSGMSFVPKNTLQKIKINLPSLVEQKKIVKVLDVWELVVEKLEWKIVAKENIKKDLMQQLLTGKKRLSGFDDEWKECELSDIAEITKGQGLSKSKLLVKGEFKCMLYGEIYTTYNEVIKNVVSRTNFEEGFKSEKGDVLLPASTTTSHLDLATATTILEDDVLLGGDINIIRDKKNFFDGIFLAHYLTHAKKHELARLAQGVTIIHLYGSHFKKLKIKLPKIEEQKAIAEILTTADEEVKMLREKLDILKDQKKFLLNNLVTGQIRVPE